MSFYNSGTMIKHHKAPFILTIEWPDEPGEDDREFATLEEAHAFLEGSVKNLPWTGPRPSWTLVDADGELIEES